MKQQSRFLVAVLACFILVAMLLLPGCTSAAQNAEKTPEKLLFTVPGEIDYKTNTKKLFYGREVCRMDTIVPLDVFYDLLENYCHSIVIAKYKGIEDIYKTLYVHHKFELIEVIKGDFTESEISVKASHNKEYEDAIYLNEDYIQNPYKQGENCIVFLQKSDRLLVYNTYEFRLCRGK